MLQTPSVSAAMAARGALVTPWIFQDFNTKSSWNPDVASRVALLRQLASYARDYYGDTPRGQRQADACLAWHLGFFCHYRPAVEDGGEYEGGLPRIEALLRCTDVSIHARMVEGLAVASSDSEALRNLNAVAKWEANTIAAAAQTSTKDSYLSRHYSRG